MGDTQPNGIKRRFRVVIRSSAGLYGERVVRVTATNTTQVRRMFERDGLQPGEVIHCITAYANAGEDGGILS